MQLTFYSFFIIIIATIINVQSYIYNIFGYAETKGGKEGRKNKHKYKFVKIKTDLYRQT